MQVEVIANTIFHSEVAEAFTDYRSHIPDWEAIMAKARDPEEFDDLIDQAFKGTPRDADELGEFAGRNCYEAWQRKRPATATNEGYLDNIINMGHYSVLEHSSMSFYVSGVSRSLLAELSRHRHLSFSVVSQRYVRLTESRVTKHPTVEKYGSLYILAEDGYEWTIEDESNLAIEGAFASYNAIADRLLAEGLPKKKALEAARTVLPNCVDSPMVVSGNLRAWRDVLGKRYHESADEEIKEFAVLTLDHLRKFAPHSFQDFPEEPFK